MPMRTMGLSFMPGAIEAERMPEPAEAAAHSRGRVMSVGADPAPRVEPE